MTTFSKETPTASCKADPCYCCAGRHHDCVASYDHPPPGETDFALKKYNRTLWRCRSCGHFSNRQSMLTSDVYTGVYVDNTYGKRMAETYDRIMALPPDKSDNRCRIERINAWWQSQGHNPGALLDVGSGLAVFPAGMRETGWTVTALDPDPRAAEHAHIKAGVAAIAADFSTFETSERFNLISFNKVLEHVENMEELLIRGAQLLKPNGSMYVEVPDGEAAFTAEGPDREEFFIEHLCAFSFASLALLLHRAGLVPATISRLIEPSGKYTLQAFVMTPSHTAQ